MSTWLAHMLFAHMRQVSTPVSRLSQVFFSRFLFGFLSSQASRDIHVARYSGWYTAVQSSNRSQVTPAISTPFPPLIFFSFVASSFTGSIIVGRHYSISNFKVIGSLFNSWFPWEDDRFGNREISLFIITQWLFEANRSLVGEIGRT